MFPPVKISSYKVFNFLEPNMTQYISKLFKISILTTVISSHCGGRLRSMAEKLTGLLLESAATWPPTEISIPVLESGSTDCFGNSWIKSYEEET